MDGSNDTATTTGVVVVGVDGSEASKDALRWALRYARLTGATVRAVAAWQYPYSFAWPVATDIDLEGETRRTLKETIEEVAASYPDVTVDSVVAKGAPAYVLTTAAKHADLLVVGSRGHGAFAGMLLGSVSQHCVHHAACSVVVVRPNKPEDRKEGPA
jgi:nucleotide-binding universal stress UspA family protein